MLDARVFQSHHSRVFAGWLTMTRDLRIDGCWLVTMMMMMMMMMMMLLMLMAGMSSALPDKKSNDAPHAPTSASSWLARQSSRSKRKQADTTRTRCAWPFGLVDRFDRRRTSPVHSGSEAGLQDHWLPTGDTEPRRRYCRTCPSLQAVIRNSHKHASAAASSIIMSQPSLVTPAFCCLPVAHSFTAPTDCCRRSSRVVVMSRGLQFRLNGGGRRRRLRRRRTGRWLGWVARNPWRFAGTASRRTT
ncbi:hypothetical protein V1506DRAFT_125823 [Lipomyces tetrasporus]